MNTDETFIRSKFDKVTIITGASQGIGEACARVFVEAGAPIVICARRQDVGEELAAELTAKGPGTCNFVKCDVTNEEEIKHLIDRTVEIHGRLDCLLNNAGWHPDHRPIDNFSGKEFEDLLRLNIVSYFLTCKYALPFLRQTQGNIINMSSLVGNMGQEWATTYVATKGAITAFTKALAIDEARYGVRVNVVLPGRHATPGYWDFINSQDDPEDAMRFNDSMQWLGRMGTSEDVAYACLFLASDGAGFLTGTELLITGGAELGYGVKEPIRYLVHPGIHGRGESAPV